MEIVGWDKNAVSFANSIRLSHIFGGEVRVCFHLGPEEVNRWHINLLLISQTPTSDNVLGIWRILEVLSGVNFLAVYVSHHFHLDGSRHSAHDLLLFQVLGLVNNKTALNQLDLIHLWNIMIEFWDLNVWNEFVEKFGIFSGVFDDMLSNLQLILYPLKELSIGHILLWRLVEAIQIALEFWSHLLVVQRVDMYFLIWA